MPDLVYYLACVTRWLDCAQDGLLGLQLLCWKMNSAYAQNHGCLSIGRTLIVMPNI